MLFIFFMFLHPLEKELPVNPLHPSEISGFKPPSPLEFPATFRGGGGGGDGYFLEPHNGREYTFSQSKIVSGYSADNFCLAVGGTYFLLEKVS